MATLSKKQRSLAGLLLLLLLGYLLYYNFRIQLTGYGDDSTLFLEPLQQNYGGNMLRFLLDRYQVWSSRIIIEFFTLLAVQHYWFWRIGNTLAMLVAIAGPPALLSKKLNFNVGLLLSFGLFQLMPDGMFSETGWVSTTTNYMWVLGAGLLTCCGIAAAGAGKTGKGFRLLYISGLLALIYAGNSEQMAVILLAVSGAACLTAWYQKNGRLKRLLPFLGGAVVSLLVIMLAPGNKIRFAEEVANWFPDFQELSFFRKVELGYSTTLRHLFLQGNQLMLAILLLLLCISIWQKRGSFQHLFLVYPLTVWLFFGPLGQWSATFPWVSRLLAGFNAHGTIFRLTDPSTWGPELLISSCLLALVLGLYCLLGARPALLGAWGLLLLAIGVRTMLGLSPTIEASGVRTYLFTYSLLILLSLFVLSERRIIQNR